MRRVGLIKKKFLTQHEIGHIIDYLIRAEKQHKWTKRQYAAWVELYNNKDEVISRIYHSLNQQYWEFKPFKVFDIVENGKHRKILESCPEDLIVDTLLFRCLEYVFIDVKKMIHPNSYGSIRNKGQHKLRQKIIRMLRDNYNGVVAIVDTKQYYPTINHEVMMDIIKRHVKDKWLIWLVDITLQRMGDKGIALGLPSSNILGHVYHSEVDWKMTNLYGCKNYYRFCDDKYIITDNTATAHEYAKILRELIVNDLKQEYKPNWRVASVKTERVDILGAMVNSENAYLRRKLRRSIERRLRRIGLEPYERFKAQKVWGGIKGSLRDLTAGNLIKCWKNKYPRFFDCLLWDKDRTKIMRKAKRKHKKLEKYILRKWA